MTEKEKCFQKNTYFEEKGAKHAIRFQPDKKHYKCSVCHFWHLTKSGNGLTRESVAKEALRQNTSIVKKKREHFICKVDGKVFYVVFELKGLNMTRRKLELVEVVDEDTMIPKQLIKLMNESPTRSICVAPVNSRVIAPVAPIQNAISSR